VTARAGGRRGLWPAGALALSLLAAASLLVAHGPAAPFRPPAVPLVAVDPYLSIWSAADKLTDAPTTHWTRRPHRLTSLVRVDGTVHRIMGNEPAEVPPLDQVRVTVRPTRTIYEFRDAAIALSLTFTTPALPEDLAIFSRPVTYLTWEVHSRDGRSHRVSIYFDSTLEAAVNEPGQEVTWSEDETGGLVLLRGGTKDLPILEKKGDNLRIDWGYLYVAAPRSADTTHAIVRAGRSRGEFEKRGALSPAVDNEMPRAVSADAPVLAFAVDLGEVRSRPVSRYLMLAYDDLYSIQYFHQNLRPYWRKPGMEAPNLLEAASRGYVSLTARSAAFDDELTRDLTKAGGEKYATLCALAYRQCLAGNKLAEDARGQPLLFPKENTSNGCIGTVDVIYPMSPQFLLFGPSLTKAMLVPVLDYASSPRWRLPFAPHDLGTYPKANGQVYGGGERTEENQMPVEETANLLILVSALAQMEGNASFAGHYWPVLTKWAEYLEAKGFDPENQLCTDDFAGHLAHNVNLSAKAIIALGAFGKLCEMRGERDRAARYASLAKGFAARWLKEADDGDHFRLAFDKGGTWSQKYNLVWDRILDLRLFPPQAIGREMAFYRRMLDPFGLALDNRRPYTKIDWTLWSATLTASEGDFDALVDPAYQYLSTTTDRVPMSDWYWTKTGRDAGMHARPVVGALFIKLLYDRALWSKWAGRDRTNANRWAPFPDANYVPPPQPSALVPIVPTAQQEPATWRYTTVDPGAGWFAPGFDAGTWMTGEAGFGTKGTPGSVVRTEWKTADIWLRREVTLPPGVDASKLYLLVHHDEDVEVYVNGVLAARDEGYLTRYELLEIRAEAKRAIRPGTNVLAVHCHQTGGGQYIDIGLSAVR
jgi:hypothetical protein